MCGILFSKLAELVMANILGGAVGFALAVEPAVILQTLTLFAVIFLLILLNSLRQIHLSKPVELLRSDRVGENPEGQLIFGVAGRCDPGLCLLSGVVH